jgi:hypothetical protein
MVTARVGEIANSRAPIEQVKGMLMLIYDMMTMLRSGTPGPWSSNPLSVIPVPTFRSKLAAPAA